MKQKYSMISVFLIGLSLPVSLLVAKVAELYYKSANPNTIDISAKLAYSEQRLIGGLIMFCVILVIGLVFSLMGLKQDEHKALSRISLLLAGMIIPVTLVSFLVQNRINSVEKVSNKKLLNSFLQGLSK